MTRFAKLLIGMSIHSWVELLDKNHPKCSMDKGTGLDSSRMDKGSPFAHLIRTPLSAA